MKTPYDDLVSASIRAQETYSGSIGQPNDMPKRNQDLLAAIASFEIQPKPKAGLLKAVSTFLSVAEDRLGISLVLTVLFILACVVFGAVESQRVSGFTYFCGSILFVFLVNRLCLETAKRLGGGK